MVAEPAHPGADRAGGDSEARATVGTRKLSCDFNEFIRVAGEHDVRFLDEVHRFSKSQQDALLPTVEDGTITLIGATTENPFFEVNGPLLSRSTLFRLEPLNATSLRTLLDRG